MRYGGHLDSKQIMRESLIKMFTDPLIVGLFSFLFISVIASIIYGLHTRKKFLARMKELTAGALELTASEFLEMVHVRGKTDFTGCYIIHNETQDLYYVGQSKSVLKRVTEHLSGRGNGDIYADLKYGDAITVKTLSFTESGYESLNSLKRDLIRNYDAYRKGYNKTRGNRD